MLKRKLINVIGSMAFRRVSSTTEDPFVTADDALDEIVDARVDERLRRMSTTMSTSSPVSAATSRYGNAGFERYTGASSEDDSKVADWVLVVGGILVLLYLLNKVFNYIYFRAISNIDLANRHQDYGSARARFWRAVETILRHGWIPLWFTHRDIFHNAIRVNLDQEHQRVRLQNMMDQGNPVPNLRFQDMLHGHVIDTQPLRVEHRQVPMIGHNGQHQAQHQAQPVAMPQRAGQVLALPAPAAAQRGQQQAAAAAAVVHPNQPSPRPIALPTRTPVARFVRVPEGTRVVFEQNNARVNDENVVDRNHQPEVGRGIEMTDDGYLQPVRNYEIYQDPSPAVRRVNVAQNFPPG